MVGFILNIILTTVIVSLEVSPHTGVRDVYNYTPLHLACVYGHKDIIQFLVEVGKCNIGESFTVSLDPLIGNVDNS